MVFNKDHPHLRTAYAKCLRELWIKRISKHKDFKPTIYSTVPGNLPNQKFSGVKILNYASKTPLNGEDGLLSAYKSANADIYFTQVDAQVLNKTPGWSAENLLNWIAYIPLDFYPISDKLISVLSKARKVITMCSWAQRELKKRIDNVTGAVYHGVDTSIFRVRDKVKKSGTFDVCLVQANRFRKMWPSQLEGIKHFADNNSDIKVKVFAHTSISGDWRLNELIEKFNLKNVVFPDQDKLLRNAYSDLEIAKLYAKSDVNLFASPEGFGLPTIEAMACGTPTIGLDFGSTREILEPITPKLLVKSYETIMVDGVEKPCPEPYEIADALEFVLKNKIKREVLAKYAKKFSWNSAASKICALLRDVLD